MVVDARLGGVAGGMAERDTDAGEQDEGKQGDSQASLQSRRAVCRFRHPAPGPLMKAYGTACRPGSRPLAAEFFLHFPFSIVGGP